MASLTGPIAFYGSAVAKGFEFLATAVSKNGGSTAASRPSGVPAQRSTAPIAAGRAHDRRGSLHGGNDDALQRTVGRRPHADRVLLARWNSRQRSIGHVDVRPIAQKELEECQNGHSGPHERSYAEEQRGKAATFQAPPARIRPSAASSAVPVDDGGVRSEAMRRSCSAGSRAGAT
jgi:hypothetical protein